MTVSDRMDFMLEFTQEARVGRSLLAAGAVTWFHACRVLRRLEGELLKDNAPADALRKHRIVISDLIADGEILSFTAREKGEDFRAVGFTVEDVEAETRLLRDSYRMFHAPMEPEEAGKTLEAAFGDR